MCYEFYEEYGKPEIINKDTKRAAALAEAIYGFNCVGGNCHIVLDDFNIEDSDIDYCLKKGLDINIHKHNEEELKIEKEFLLAFKALNINERVSALAIYEGWLKI